MKIEINLESILNNAISNSLSDEFLQPIISKCVEKSVKDAVESQFGYNAPFKKLIEESISEKMPTNIEDLGRFSDLVLKVLSQHLNNAQNEHIKNVIEPEMQRLLGEIPKTIKLSELIKKIVNNFDDDDKKDDSPTIIVEKSEISEGHWDLYIDPVEYVGRYRCKIAMRFDNDGSCWSLKLDNEEVNKKLFIGCKFNVDAYLLNIYTNQVKVELDKTDFDDIYYENRVDY